MRTALATGALGTIACMLVTTLVAGCAASKSNAAPPSAARAAEGGGQPGYPSGSAQDMPHAEAAQPAQAPAPAPPPPSQTPSPQAGAPTTPSTPSAEPPPSTSGKTPAAGASGRSMAIQSASREIDQSQRELDVAGSDCRNACRALGSMDRAAGRLCELSRGDGEPQRCDDAKRRVYSARDRVRTTCGTCADGTTVERAAPIPSR